MKKQRKSMLVLAMITAFITTGLLLPAIVEAGDLDPSVGPDDPASAMYTLEDIYNYLDTGVAGTKRTGGFVEPTLPPGSTGNTLDDVHAKISEKCITCTGTLNGTRWCDNLDGTVTDMTTGLVWLKKADWGGLKPWRNSSVDCSSPNYTCYDDAHTRAGILSAGTAGADLSDGSVEGDWRLPTKTELINLASGTEPVLYGTPRAFTGVQDDFYYWSSTTLAGAYLAYAWLVHMLDGDVGAPNKVYDGYVWPVRGGN